MNIANYDKICLYLKLKRRLGMESDKIKKIKEECNKLKDEGELLLKSFAIECKIIEEPKKDTELPNFTLEYQKWYSKSYLVIKQFLPDRLSDFVNLYKLDKRKEIRYSTYTISDALLGITVRDGFGEIKVSPQSAISKFQQQITIVDSVLEVLDSSLNNIQQLVQADIFDSEIDTSKELLKKGFIRAAGAICGVVLEKHFSTVLDSHSLNLSKKNPTINDYNELLKNQDIIDIPTWRHIQLLGDIRNLCDHDKKQEPTKEQVQSLIDGTDKIIKTVF